MRPVFGGTHTLHVQLRRYRGGLETVSLPVTMPAQASGPVSLLVSDAAGVVALEDTELRPQGPTSLDALWRRVQQTRPNPYVYVRLIVSDRGSAVAGQSQPALPGSMS